MKIQNSQVFCEILTDVVIEFTNVINKLNHDIMLLYDFAQKNIQYFNIFQKSSKFKYYWILIEKKYVETERNKKSAHKITKFIKQVWENADNILLQIRNANQFVWRLE